MSKPPETTSRGVPSDGNRHLLAIVKGGGPAGLGAAVALAQNGFLVHVIEKRPARGLGEGRRNVVALRAEGLRQLEALGALRFALDSKSGNGTSGSITQITTTKTINEMPPCSGAFPWPLVYYTGPEGYNVPGKVNEQKPSSYINLGDLEDCLTQAAIDLGVKFTYGATVSLRQNADRESYTAFLRENDRETASLGTPDLIVCASGKNDTILQAELNILRRIGDFLSDENLPNPTAVDPVSLRFNETRLQRPELESQQMYVFGIKHSHMKAGYFETYVRKYSPDNQPGEEQIIEIQMNQPTAIHFILQPPRSLTSPQVEAYILSRINQRLESSYQSLQAIKESGDIAWGDSTKSVVIETSTATKYVYGDNVVLVGDCAMSCSPSSGIGAEIALTVDSQSIRRLGVAMKERLEAGDEKERTKSIREALVKFNLEKAESAVMWSQTSRYSYVTREEAEKWKGHSQPKGCEADVH